MSNSKRKHGSEKSSENSIESALIAAIVIMLILLIVLLFMHYFVKSERVSEAVDAEIPSEKYGKLNIVLTMQRISGTADEKLLTKINKALKDRKITEREMNEIVAYHNSTFGPNPQKSGLIENVEMMLSQQEKQP